jgi:NADPH:quinone reductase-like Zn-dependent oxidoreductase
MASLPKKVNGAPPSVPTTMRGWAHTASGLPTSILKLTADLPVPKIKTPTDVLIKIRYAALNPGVSVMMQFVPIIFRTKPSIPEFDFSGTIAQLGSAIASTRNLKVDTEVFGSIPLGSLVMAGQGALAEYVVVS